MTIKENKDVIFEELHKSLEAAGRNENSVTVIGVTKYADLDATKELIEAGICHLGENRVDKFLAKYHALQDKNLTWHFIGSVQRRKVKDFINQIDYFHALDSINLAKEIQKRAEKPIKCFLQLNVSGEESKHGFSPDELDDIIPQLEDLDKLQLVGLMTMAPLEANPETLHNIFKETNHIRQELQSQNRKNMPFTELSMGMSNDYPIAVQNGATFVRIGTSFFK